MNCTENGRGITSVQSLFVPEKSPYTPWREPHFLLTSDHKLFFAVYDGDYRYLMEIEVPDEPLALMSETSSFGLLLCERQVYAVGAEYRKSEEPSLFKCATSLIYRYYGVFRGRPHLTPFRKRERGRYFSDGMSCWGIQRGNWVDIECIAGIGGIDFTVLEGDTARMVDLKREVITLPCESQGISSKIVLRTSENRIVGMPPQEHFADSVPSFSVYILGKTLDWLPVVSLLIVSYGASPEIIENTGYNDVDMLKREKFTFRVDGAPHSLYQAPLYLYESL